MWSGGVGRLWLKFREGEWEGGASVVRGIVRDCGGCWWECGWEIGSVCERECECEGACEGGLVDMGAV